jgi:hypothetical protein
MTEKQLTAEQIQSLFDFVKSKYVRYIDVQFELVDHLASAIEDEMQKDSKLSFEAALSKVYARFPITGFTNFVASKASSLSSYWRRRYFNLLLSYFTPPKIFLTLLIYIFAFQTAYFFGKGGLAVLIFVSYIINIGFLYNHYRSIKFIKGKQQNYLFLQSSWAGSGIPFVLQYWSIIFLNHIFADDQSNTLNLMHISLQALVCALSLITAHANFTIFPKMIYDEINNKYKHLGIVVR